MIITILSLFNIIIRPAWKWLNNNFFVGTSESLTDTSYDKLVFFLEQVNYYYYIIINLIFYYIVYD